MSSKRAVFITGGSHGLGLATARSLIAQGSAVALFARDKGRLDQARGHLLEDEPGAEIEVFTGDVCHYESLGQSVQRFAESQGGLESVVHGAGQMRGIGPLDQVDLAAWRADIETSLIGAGHLIKAALPWLEKSSKGGSVVVFVGSGHHQGLGFGSGYSAAQAGLVRLIENLALERVWPKSAGQGPEGFVGYYALFPAVTPTGVMDYVLREAVGRKWLPRFTEMFGEGKEVETHVPAAMAAWLCQKKPAELSGRVVSGMLDPELTEMRLGILGEGEKGLLRLKL